MRIWEETLDWLAVGLGNTLTTLAPERLIIGGGVEGIKAKEMEARNMEPQLSSPSTSWSWS